MKLRDLALQVMRDVARIEHAAEKISIAMAPHLTSEHEATPQQIQLAADLNAAANNFYKE